MADEEYRNPAELARALIGAKYVPSFGLAAAVFLARRLERPLFLEGEPGVGKTQLAKTMAELLRVPLIRLQCYGGIDAAQALYDWNFAKQILRIRAAETDESVYTVEFLVERRILTAIRTGHCVLLIDEIDRADDEFEALLLEVLEDYTITIPELGPIVAPVTPLVFLTSNRTREVHDALKRRCLYHWIEHPPFEREVEIVRSRVDGIPESVAREAVSLIGRLRDRDRLELVRRPGVAESIDLAGAALALGAEAIDEQVAELALGAYVKQEEDVPKVRKELPKLFPLPVSGTAS
ncbi:MAG TPA: MoxR family ATPase [Rugosimonospora sp.]